MNDIKCRMCGSILDCSYGMSSGKCSRCGAFQTFPRVYSERRANLYDRAGYLRRNNEYDRAEKIYRQIIAEDACDAEAYWSVVLCHYGVEYTEDCSTGKYVVNINRTRSESVFSNQDYRSAIKFADDVQKVMYQAEAHAIDEVLKGILEISETVLPYDVYICCMETDRYGRKTQDSLVASGIYQKLTDKGLRVFLARISLEDKSGADYEPYIYSALNSSKVMIVAGARPENYTSVWVKNEWSRYLEISGGGKGKLLIPVFSGISQYDLPDEFSHLKALDYDSSDFMKQLSAEIDSVISSESRTENNPVIAENVSADKSGDSDDGNNSSENQEVLKLVRHRPVRITAVEKNDRLFADNAEKILGDGTQDCSMPEEFNIEYSEWKHISDIASETREIIDEIVSIDEENIALKIKRKQALTFVIVLVVIEILIITLYSGCTFLLNRS